MDGIYPLNVRIISGLLNLADTSDLFREVINYAFVKQLPNGWIKLQDVMETMVNDHVWPEVDPGGERRCWYSTQVLPCFKIEIDDLSQQIEKHKQNRDLS